MDFKKIIMREHMEMLSRKNSTFFFLAVQHSMQDLSAPTRDRTPAPCSGSTES